MRTLEHILQAPDLLNPYGLDYPSMRETPDFFRDLHAGSVVGMDDDCPMAINIFACCVTSVDTANYRLDIFDDLDRDLVGKLWELYSAVHKIVHINYIWSLMGNADMRRDFRYKSEYLINYLHCIDTFPNIGDVESEGLKSLVDFFSEIKNTLSYKRLEEDIRQLAMMESHYNDCLEGPFCSRAKEIIDFHMPQVKEVQKVKAMLVFYLQLDRFFERLKEKGYDLCRPVLLPKEERKMNVKDAKHPLLDVKDVVPNDIKYDKDNNVFVITGINSGGKTVYVQTLGLIQQMAQHGLYVPASYAEVSIVDNILTHFVRPDDIKKQGGLFEVGLKRLIKVAEQATPYSLVILNELCNGTSMGEAFNPSIAFLDAFHRLGCPTYFVTHMHNIADEVDKGRYIAAKNLHVEHVGLNPTYRIKDGQADKSHADAIVKKLGATSKNVLNMVRQRALKLGYLDMLRTSR